VLRATTFLDPATADAIEAARPGFMSKSGWLAFMAHLGLHAYRQSIGAPAPATCQQAPSAAPEA